MVIYNLLSIQNQPLHLICWFEFRAGHKIKPFLLTCIHFKITADAKADYKSKRPAMLTYNMENGYAVINRTWKKNDMVEVNLPMEVRRVVANENVKDDIGKVALQRGPLMYCAEWPDNNGKTSNFIIPAGTVLPLNLMPTC